MTSEATLARCLMVQGTSSHAGKSVMVAALCRLFAQNGWRVAPFKAQNMSLNSFVTTEGGEMGRAQVLQAMASGIEPHTYMNPILLKPLSDEKAQVIVNGKPVGNMDALEYHLRKTEFFPQALEALEELRTTYEIVVMEGAGSPAEINLKDQDITNMRIAEAADAPVVLVGDIDLGGVFASLVGTMELLDPTERERVAGFIINKFRGSRDLLQDGLDFLEKRTGKPVLGVMPFIRNLGLEEEDTINLEELRSLTGRGTVLDIGVLKLPHISNFTDFDPLMREQGVGVRYISDLSELGFPDAIIIPGTKNSIEDLQYLRRIGMIDGILEAARKGIPVLGICGGYQMLGKWIKDPDGWESGDYEVEGLGLLATVTRITGEKRTHQVKAKATREIPLLGLNSSSPDFRGYEIHMGESIIDGEPALMIIERDREKISINDGALHDRLPVFGCYLHGLFENRHVREGFLNYLRVRKGLPQRTAEIDWDKWRDDRLDRLARIARSSLRVQELYALVGKA